MQVFLDVQVEAGAGWRRQVCHLSAEMISSETLMVETD